MFKEFTGNIGINCRTKQEAEDLFQLLYINGYNWVDKRKLINNTTEDTLWHSYKEKAVYTNKVSVFNLNGTYHKEFVPNIKIITYPEFIDLITINLQ